MPRLFYRCARCDAHVVLRKAPEAYVRPPRCPSCRKVARFYPDRWRARRRTGVGGEGCNCGAYPFIHRRGSLYCDANPAHPPWRFGEAPPDHQPEEVALECFP